MKKKVDSLHVPAIKINRVEAVGLKIPIILLNLRFLWICEIWGNFLEIWYFVNKSWIEVRI